MTTTGASLDAVLLVGGKGTRLRTVVDDRPKPLAEVTGRPFLEWLLLWLRNQGLLHVILCTGHMAEVIEDYFENGARWSMDIRYSRDPTPLGTGGAVRNALDQVTSDPFLVMNGDSYCPVDIGLLHEAHMARSASATIWAVSAASTATAEKRSSATRSTTDCAR